MKNRSPTFEFKKFPSQKLSFALQLLPHRRSYNVHRITLQKFITEFKLAVFWERTGNQNKGEGTDMKLEYFFW